MKFNVIYQHPAGADSAVSAEYLEGTKRSEIVSVYIIDCNRMATDEEIGSLCAGTWQGI